MMAGGTEGAEARARWEKWSSEGLDFLIGIAGAVAVEGAGRSFDKVSDNPAGDPTEDGMIKSSKFMISD